MKIARVGFSLLVIVGLLACASVVYAATYLVMQDGTGDFELIQPALDAVASGDTLLIGPGEYTASNPTYIPGYAWDVDVFGFISVDELTIIGAGVNETVIGPLSYEGSSSTYSPKGLVWLEGTVLRIQALSMRNCYDGIHATNAPIYIEDCAFLDNGIGVTWYSVGSGGGFSGCTFEASLPGSPLGVFILGSGNGILFEGCQFEGAKASLKDIQDVSFIDCQFQNSLVGLQLDGGIQGLIENCNIINCTNVGLAVFGSGTACTISDCEVSGSGSAVFVDEFCTLFASQTIFSGGHWSVIEFINADASQITDCSLFPGSGPAIRSFRHPNYGEVIYDLRNNFWGTEDGDEIRALILDGSDDPDNASTVLFEPFVGGPVATKEMTLDGIKAMFR